MISKIHAALSEARDGVEYGYLSPHKAVMIPAREFDAFMKKLGLDNKKAGDYPHHLKRFREKIQLLKEEVDETVAFGEYVADGENYGITSWEVFKASREAGAACKFDYDYLKEEICQVHRAILDARENIQLGPVPPLDAVKIPMDKFKAFMEKFGLDNVKGEDYPLHLLRFRRKIELLKEAVDDIVAFGKYVAAGKNGEAQPCWFAFRDWYEGEDSDSEYEYEYQSDTLPTAQDQIATPCG